MTGWKFDDLGITIRQRLCEALYAAGHAKQAGESLLEITHLVNKQVHISTNITQWVSGWSYLPVCCTYLTWVRRFRPTMSFHTRKLWYA